MRSKSILVVTTVLSIVATNIVMADLQSFPVCTNGKGSDPAISGNIVVWGDCRGLDGIHDIYGYDLISQTEFPIAIKSGYQVGQAISGNFVVWYGMNERWTEELGIYAYNLTTGKEIRINERGSAPDIDSGIVVWAENHDIYGYNLLTNTEFPIYIGNATSPAISGDIVVWSDHRNGDYDIYGYNLTTGNEFPVCIAPGHQTAVDINGDIVAWHDERNGAEDIYAYNISTGVEVLIPSGGDGFFPSISANIVLWEDRNNIIDSDIYGYNLTTGIKFPVCTIPGSQGEPDINGNMIVWNNVGDIYGAYIPEPSTLLLLGFGAIILRKHKHMK